MLGMSGEEIKLKHVTDSIPGYTRKKKGRGWMVLGPDGKICRSEEIITRIRRLVIPPAWKNVWISPFHDSHLQATGIDIKGRKQYLYHPQWRTVRNNSKYGKLLDFGYSLPLIRQKLDRDLACKKLTHDKVVALVVKILDLTCFRIGSNFYEKQYGSFGLTTLKDKHVEIDGHFITFKFKGKKGVPQQLTIKNKLLSKLVKQCRDLPGQELFQYYDENNQLKTVGSADVNNYLHDITGKDFSSKDFRTWGGSVHAIHAAIEAGDFKSQHQMKIKMNQIIDYVSTQLGNTRSVCKKYYIHPTVLELYGNGVLNDLFKKGETLKPLSEKKRWLSWEENLLMAILKFNMAEVKTAA